MEHQKKLNSLNEASDSRFVTKKWSIVNVQTNTNYDAGNEIFYNTEVLKSNLCDNIDAYILARGDITNAGDNGVEIAFKNCSKFNKCIAKNDGTTIDDAEDLNLVMPMYNMLENSSNYSDTRQFMVLLKKLKQTILILILEVTLLLRFLFVKRN